MKLRLNRSLDDIPAQASDAELLEWAAELTADGSTPERPREPVKLKWRATFSNTFNCRNVAFFIGSDPSIHKS